MPVLKQHTYSSQVTQLCLILCNPMDWSYQASPSMGFSRQEYWSGLPFPPPGIFPTSGSNPGLHHCGQIIYLLRHEASPSGLAERHKYKAQLSQTTNLYFSLQTVCIQFLEMAVKFILKHHITGQSLLNLNFSLKS